MSNKFDRVAIFDLDGTLTDPLLGIHQSVNVTEEILGYQLSSVASVRSVIGPPLREAMSQLGFVEDDLDIAIATYRDHYRRVGLYNNVPFAGIYELLTSLQDRDVVLAVATSKIQPWAHEVLEHFNLRAFFRVVAGASLDGSRDTKAEIIVDCLKELGDVDRSHTLMIGDRRHDVEGAAASDLSCIGVLWGYGTDEELRSSGAVALARDVSDLELVLESLWFARR